MSSLITKLLKPLPVEQRVVPQQLHPLFNSRACKTFIGTGFRISREMRMPSGELRWDNYGPADDLRLPSRGHIIPRQRVVTALPRNDPNRPIPKNAKIESVWTLLAYLCELGPVEAPIVACSPVWVKKDNYIAYWGPNEYLGQRLWLIRHKTPHRPLQRLVDNALELVSFQS